MSAALKDYEILNQEAPELAAVCQKALARLPGKIKEQEEREKEEMLGKLLNV
jgi:hypothetical protein